MQSDEVAFEDFDAYFDTNNVGEGPVYDGGRRCELATFESRRDSKGNTRLLSVGSRQQLDPEPHHAWDSALVLTRFYDKDMELEHTELEIRSPHVKAALKHVVPEYHDLNLLAKKVVLRDHPKCLFHYRKELQEYGARLEDPEAIRHLMFALKYMYKILQSEIYTYYNLVEITSTSPSIDFSNLWMVFRPGDNIIVKDHRTMSVLEFEYMTRDPCLPLSSSSSEWIISAKRIDYDGTNFGVLREEFHIKPYNGNKLLKELRVIPLQYHPDQRSIVPAMIKRGKKFISLHGKHHRAYKGIAEVLSENRVSSIFGDEDEFSLQFTLINGRVMIDAKTFGMARPTHSPHFSGDQRIIYTEMEDHLRLADDDYLICHHSVAGFSLDDKSWCFFKVDLIQDIEYNLTAFDTLVLEEEYKQMILSLVKIHEDTRLSFDDVIKGKGRGMVFLLHGITGVGKTLTAESVADFTKRPLFTLSAGELGSSSKSVETGLGDAIKLAETWHAIILIDEADIFMEQRNLNDLERNSLVSVFLRMLEYYEGIMFLTTNRIGVFDAAFKSRIHLAIKYPALSSTSRETLWRTFITRASPGVNLNWLYSVEFGKLANEDVNGRQIKNVVRTAHALAISQSSNLELHHIHEVLKAVQAFESDFAETVAATRAEGKETLTDGLPSKRRRVG